MSRPTPRWILVGTFAALTLGSTASVAAQRSQGESSSAQEELLMRRIDSLLPLQAEARREADRVKDLREEEVRRQSIQVVDTLTVGGLRVITPPGQARLAEEMVSEVWAEYGSYEGSPSLRESVLTFQWAEQRQPIYVSDAPVQHVEHRRWRSRAYVTRAIRRSIGGLLLRDVEGTRLSEWVSAPLVEPTDLSLTYRELAAIPSRLSRECLENENGRACWGALGLGIEPTDLGAWYTPEERYVFVSRRLSRFSVTYRTRPEYAGCTVEGDIDECDRIMLESGRMGWLMPLTAEARLAMLWLAVEAGGEGAWARLVEHLHAAADGDGTRVSPSEALQYVSGLTPEELGAAWRTEVLKHRPMVYAGSFPVHWTSLMWIALFAAMAMRSTRWRLG